VSDPKLGRRYADALYDSAKKHGIVPDMMDAMDALNQSFRGHPEIVRFWSGFQVKPQQKKTAIQKALKDAPSIVRNFLFLLIDKKREALLFDVFTALNARHDLELGLVRATLTTAVELKENEGAGFSTWLKQQFGGVIELSQKVDESLIAGFRLRYGNRIIDASVERAIKEIRRRVSA